VPFENIIAAMLAQFPVFYGTRTFKLSCSEEPTSGPYHEPVKHGPDPQNLFLQDPF
jgi:hypothetical protein